MDSRLVAGSLSFCCCFALKAGPWVFGLTYLMLLLQEHLKASPAADGPRWTQTLAEAKQRRVPALGVNA